MLDTKRAAAFLLGCIPARLAIVLVALAAPLTWLRWLAVPAALIAAGFWAIFLGGWRKTGVETGGQPIWWNALRPVHGSLWGAAAFFAWRRERSLAWRLLLADACLGILAFSVHHAVFAGGK